MIFDLLITHCLLCDELLVQVNFVIVLFLLTFCKISHFPHSRFTPRTPNPNLFAYPKNIKRRVQIINLLVVEFSPSSSYFCIRSKYYFDYSILRHTQSVFFGTIVTV